jgi:hypothetical protein
MAFAQEEFDGLKYSLQDINGSARYVAMSGAFGALGGDMSTLSMNPAGIAVYRSSELAISPFFSSNSAKSLFNQTESSNSKSKVLINNFGYVGSFRTYDESAISNFNFGIAYNKIKDFNRDFYIVGKSPSSLLDKISNDANNGGSDLTDYAYETWLINQNQTSGLYESILNDGENTKKYMFMSENGAVNEWAFSLGTNYGHILYLGMTLGLQSINYEMSSVYNEDFDEGGGLELRNVLNTQGSGVSFKGGVIYRPVPELRLGFAYHSPTYYYMTDSYGASMASMGLTDPSTGNVFDPNPTYQLDDASADYQLKTPGLLMYLSLIHI